MKRALILRLILGIFLGIILTASPCLFAQDSGNAVYFQSAGPVTTVGVGMVGKGQFAPVQGAPYSAMITNESVQTLGDGTKITQTMSGNVARDSQGRTRQDAPLPVIGNMAAADAPHLVFIQDPVAQAAYTLNLKDKTAQKIPTPPMPPPNANLNMPATMAGGGKVIMQMSDSMPSGGLPPGPPPEGIMLQRTFIASDQGKATTEDLGSQTMEGVQVTGVRTTRTIATAEIGNDRPITIVTEVWTSPDLKAIIYSKRSDPRMGEQTFQLTNIVRSEPDASLFTVPSEFKIAEGPQKVLYRSNQ
jgi:hypothetical protein